MAVSQEQAERFATWLLDEAVAEARGDRRPRLTVAPEGRFWLGRLAPEARVQQSRLGERAERLEPCEVGIRVRPNSLDGRALHARVRAVAWKQLADAPDDPDPGNTATGDTATGHPDPAEAENLSDLIDAVAQGRIDIGFAFDGDGDRIGVVDGLGRILWGDQILQILVQDLLKRRPGALIMADVKCSQALFGTITALGGRALMAPTGHSLIKSGMKQSGAILAGEMTGHIFCADDYYGYDDALYAALRLLAASARLGQSLTTLRGAMHEMHATPDIRFAVPGIDPFAANVATSSQIAFTSPRAPLLTVGGDPSGWRGKSNGARAADGKLCTYNVYLRTSAHAMPGLTQNH